MTEYGRHGLRDWQVNAEPQFDENGEVVEDWVTCGHCGRRWNDALMTSRTPAPAARCPFEDEHEYEDSDD